MKTKLFGAVALCAVALLIASCKGKNDSLTGIALDKSTATVAVGSTITLTASTTPAGASATFAWTSSNTAIATVDNGVVTGVAAGTAYVLVSADGFSANCLVTVTSGEGGGSGADDSLKGSNYYLFIMDEATSKSIASKTVADLRVNDSSIALYIWPAGDSYAKGTASGKNYFGQVADWYCLVAQAAPWGGVGAGAINLNDQTADLTAIDGSYTFHIAYKSTDAGKNEICLFSADGSEKWFELPAKDDGLWHKYEVPMSVLFQQGVSFNAVTEKGKNILGFRTTGAGKTLNADACFIYKK